MQKLHYHVANTCRTKHAIAQHINCLLLHYYVVNMYWTKHATVPHVNSVCYTFTWALSKRAIAKNVATHFGFKHYVINMFWTSRTVVQCFYLLYYYLTVNIYWTKHAIAQHVHCLLLQYEQLSGVGPAEKSAYHRWRGEGSGQQVVTTFLFSRLLRLQRFLRRFLWSRSKQLLSE